MKANKLILFDWGGIVESHKTGYNNYMAWEELMKTCGATHEIDIRKYHLTSIPTEEEFEEAFNKMKEEGNLTATFKEFVGKYQEIFDKVDYYTNVRDYELSLKDECYIGILSNLNIYAKERLNKQVGLSNYDYVFLSFEMACRKPDIEIFEKVQEQLPFDKKDILFIDDRLDNCEAAREFGWNVCNATGLELDKIKEACQEFLK